MAKKKTAVKEDETVQDEVKVDAPENQDIPEETNPDTPEDQGDVNDTLEESGQDTPEESGQDTPEEKGNTDKEPEQLPPVVEKKVVKVDPHYVAFFEQFIGFVKEHKSENAIKAFSNCIKAMLKQNDKAAFDTVFEMYKKNADLLSEKVILQSVAILPQSERAMLEVVSTIFHVIVKNPKASVNLETARSVVKSDPWITWCAKKLS